MVIKRIACKNRHSDEASAEEESGIYNAEVSLTSDPSFRETPLRMTTSNCILKKEKVSICHSAVQQRNLMLVFQLKKANGFNPKYALAYLFRL